VLIPVSQKKIQWTTNRKSHASYGLAPILMTLSDLEGHSLIASIFKWHVLF